MQLLQVKPSDISKGGGARRRLQGLGVRHGSGSIGRGLPLWLGLHRCGRQGWWGLVRDGVCVSEGGGLLLLLLLWLILLLLHGCPLQLLWCPLTLLWCVLRLLLYALLLRLRLSWQ